MTKFVGIRNYENSKGEISNYVLNVGASYLNALQKDLDSIQAMTIDQLYEISDSNEISHEIADKALTELILSFKKDLSRELEYHTNNSKAQLSAYVSTGKNGIDKNLNTQLEYIKGFQISKKVLTKGNYKHVNKQPKTVVKDAIKKYLKLRTNKFRRLKLVNCAVIENGTVTKY